MSGNGLKIRLEIIFSDLNLTLGLLMNLVLLHIFDVKCEMVRINLELRDHLAGALCLFWSEWVSEWAHNVYSKRDMYSFSCFNSIILGGGDPSCLKALFISSLKSLWFVLPMPSLWLLQEAQCGASGGLRCRSVLGGKHSAPEAPFALRLVICH